MTEQPRPYWAVRLQAQREARGWTKYEMARQLMAAASIEHGSVANLARQILGWEKGEHFPRDWAPAYAAAFDLTIDELFGPIVQGQSAGLVGTVVATPIPQGDDEVKNRRELFQDTAALGTAVTIGPVLAALTHAWQASEPKLPGATVSQAMIDDWEDAAFVHAQRARVHPPVAVLNSMAADFADMAPHLAAQQPDTVRQDLAHAAAPHAMLIAGKLVDLGDRREARRWWTRTRSLADSSGDPLLASWVRSREALYRHGDPTEHLPSVLAIAQDARRLAGESASAPAVSALCAEAQTLALMGRSGQAVATLRRAEHLFDALPDGHTLPAGGDASGLWFDKSLIYSLAGDVRQATQAQEVLLRGADQLRDVLVQLHRATLHAHSDPAAIARAVEIVDAIPQQARRTRYLTAARMVLMVAPESSEQLPAARELLAITAGI